MARDAVPWIASPAPQRQQQQATPVGPSVAMPPPRAGSNVPPPPNPEAYFAQHQQHQQHQQPYAAPYSDPYALAAQQAAYAQMYGQQFAAQYSQQGHYDPNNQVAAAAGGYGQYPAYHNAQTVSDTSATAGTSAAPGIGADGGGGEVLDAATAATLKRFEQAEAGREATHDPKAAMAAAARAAKREANKMQTQCNSIFNLEPVLQQNILASEYFKSLYELKTYHEVVDEIYNTVTHVAPFVPGNYTKVPSSAFCLLYKFFVMGLSEKQVLGLLEHKDSPYIRAIGALYLRYVCPADQLWKWFEPLLDDKEELTPSTDENATMTFGRYIHKLLDTELSYFGTLFPRIPTVKHKEIQKQMIARELGISQRSEDKTETVLPGYLDADGKLTKGTKVTAVYYDDDIEYDAEVMRPTKKGYWVVFPEYGNEQNTKDKDVKPKETPKPYQPPAAQATSGSGVAGGAGGGSRDRGSHGRDSRDRSSYGRGSRSRSPDHRDRDRDRDRDRHSRSRSPRRREASHSRSRGGDDDEVERIFRERQQNAAAAHGKNYAARPTSYKFSMSVSESTGREAKHKRLYERDASMDHVPRDRRPKPPSPPPVQTKAPPSAAAIEQFNKIKDAYTSTGGASQKAAAQRVSQLDSDVIKHGT